LLYFKISDKLYKVNERCDEMLTKITNIDAFQNLIKNKNEFYFLKHSNTCPISASAFEEFQKFHYERD